MSDDRIIEFTKSKNQQLQARLSCLAGFEKLFERSRAHLRKLYPKATESTENTEKIKYE